jgi:glycine cleavage system H protein
MAETKYTEEHEWIRVEGDVGTIGITQYAQEQLGDVVFVDVPAAGRKVAKGEACAVVESVKAASDIYAPASGEVVESNAALADTPGDRSSRRRRLSPPCAGDRRPPDPARRSS